MPQRKNQQRYSLVADCFAFLFMQSVKQIKYLEVVWDEVTNNLKRCHSKRPSVYNKNRGTVSIKVSDQVMLATHYLSNKAA
ncbi:hypothetical protein PR048_015637 [Dryococelus australis]|uniref:Uncharacterized protein n=1 Tax=Dryococelus australis TaxID=614101 RepID=A0ABQ9HHG9_9NEOP|nr:hypothetical protein PR048_015637 [Dryococelus australis]